MVIWVLKTSPYKYNIFDKMTVSNLYIFDAFEPGQISFVGLPKDCLVHETVSCSTPNSKSLITK